MCKSFNVTGLGILLLALYIAVSSSGCPPPETTTLRILNTTAKTVVGVYCTPETDDSWGSNLLNGNLLAGQSVDIEGFRPGEYDMLAAFADGTEFRQISITFRPNEVYTWNLLLSTPSGK
jgi:hypothetical protein